MIDFICTRQNPDGTYDSRGWKNRTNPTLNGCGVMPDAFRVLRYIRAFGEGYGKVRVKCYSNKKLIKTMYINA